MPLKTNRISPVRLIPISFLLAILAGTILLWLPFSAAPGETTGFLTALFTATTSVCVTGLVVVDTCAHWSSFGQLVILILIQIGGLGIITVASMIMLLGKKKFYLGDHMLLGESLNVDMRKGLLPFLIHIFKGVLVVETIGAILYAVKFVPLLGWAGGLWAAVFQSVSAFCNAGMDVLGPNSMMDLRDSALVMWLTMILILLGGLGFVVWFDLIDGIKNGVRNRFSPGMIVRHLPEHSKIVLVLSAVLVLSGAACIFAAEYHNPGTIGGMTLSQKVLNSLFQSVTFRTAGFASIPQEKLTEISCVTGYVLMFIGGSPVGTAGGVKTVTAFLFFMNALSYIRGEKENVIFHRRVPEEQMRKASAIVFVSLTTVLVMTVLLMLCGGIPLTDALYEIVSALGTVGLSRGLTPTLGSAGRIILIVSMFLGRIGPISMAWLFTGEKESNHTIKHSEGTFYVG